MTSAIYARERGRGWNVSKSLVKAMAYLIRLGIPLIYIHTRGYFYISSLILTLRSRTLEYNIVRKGGQKGPTVRCSLSLSFSAQLPADNATARAFFVLIHSSSACRCMVLSFLRKPAAHTMGYIKGIDVAEHVFLFFFFEFTISTGCLGARKRFPMPLYIFT